MDLKVARRIARLTQSELAAAAGVDGSFISLLESGKRDIETVNYRTVALLARALNVTPEELFPLRAQAGAPDTQPAA